MGSTEVLPISTLGFTGRTDLQDSMVLETSQQVWTQEDLLSKEDQVWENLNKQIFIYKCVGPAMIHQ